jgi:cardiolipin synthase
MMNVSRVAGAKPPVATNVPVRPTAPQSEPALKPLQRDQVTLTAGRRVLTANVPQLEAAITKSTGKAPTPGNKMQLYVDGKNAYPQIIGLIQGAQKTLHMEMYIFRDDQASWDVAEALAERAAKGVKVRVSCDWMGSPTGSAIFDFLRANGVEVRHFTAQSLKNPTQVDHRKIIIADGAKAITGGMNIADTYKNTWHDAIITMEGPVVHDLQHTFAETWTKIGGSDIGHDASVFAPLPKTPAGKTGMRVLTTDPGQDIRQAAFHALDAAKSQINIENPYFTDDALVDKIVAAARRGVQVNIVVPAVSDVGIVKAASRHHFKRLIEAGAHVYMYKDRMVHTKAMTVDGVWGTIGSCNADNLSLRVNREMNVTFDDPEAVAQLDNDLFKQDFAHSTQLDTPRMTLREQAETWFARLINKQL